MLAKLHRAGELTPIWVPGVADEAMRDLVRLRLAAASQLHRSRVQLHAFLLRHSRIYHGTVRSWTQSHYRWWTSRHSGERGPVRVILDDPLGQIAQSSPTRDRERPRANVIMRRKIRE